MRSVTAAKWQESGRPGPSRRASRPATDGDRARRPIAAGEDARSPLVDVARGELYLPLGVQPRTGDLPEVGIAQTVIRLVVLRPVEDIETLDPQLERAISRQAEGLEH